MQHNIKSLIGHSVGATDGEIGEIEEFYFDDKSWTIRYMIVQTGELFSGHKVLIAMDALQKPDWKEKEFPVNLTIEQINNSPYIDTDKPVSRQMEMELHRHYGWQPYWGSNLYADGGMWNIMNEYPLHSQEIIKDGDSDDKHRNDDPHLRSTHAVNGYHIHALDGDIGHVHDFIIDDTSWQLKYLIIDTHNYFGGRKVLIDVKKIKEIQWDNDKVILNISKTEVINSPLFHESDYNHPELAIESQETANKQNS